MIQERRVKHAYLQCTNNTPRFRGFADGEKIRSTSVRLNKCSSCEPSGSKVPLTATRLSRALSKSSAERSHQFTKRSQEFSVIEIIQYINDLSRCGGGSASASSSISSSSSLSSLSPSSGISSRSSGIEGCSEEGCSSGLSCS